MIRRWLPISILLLGLGLILPRGAIVSSSVTVRIETPLRSYDAEIALKTSVQAGSETPGINPNGIASHSPRLPYSATLGQFAVTDLNPNGVASADSETMNLNAPAPLMRAVQLM